MSARPIPNALIRPFCLVLSMSFPPSLEGSSISAEVALEVEVRFTVPGSPTRGACGGCRSLLTFFLVTSGSRFVVGAGVLELIGLDA